jgi:hypothetical protein
LSFSAVDLSSTARLAVTAACAVLLVSVGTPFALLRQSRRTLPPQLGRADHAGWQLAGVFSDYPVATDATRASAPRAPMSDPTLLLPLVHPAAAELRGSAARLDTAELERATELYAEAVKSFTSCNPFARRLASARGPAPSPRALARQLINLYLSDEILEDVDQHCPLIALPSDVARAGLTPRAAYTTVVENMAEVYRAAFPPEDTDARRKSLLMVSLCVGVGQGLATVVYNAKP